MNRHPRGRGRNACNDACGIAFVAVAHEAGAESGFTLSEMPAGGRRRMPPKVTF